MPGKGVQPGGAARGGGGRGGPPWQRQRRCRRDSIRPPRLRRARPKNTLFLFPCVFCQFNPISIPLPTTSHKVDFSIFARFVPFLGKRMHIRNSMDTWVQTRWRWNKDLPFCIVTFAWGDISIGNAFFMFDWSELDTVMGFYQLWLASCVAFNPWHLDASPCFQRTLNPELVFPNLDPPPGLSCSGSSIVDHVCGKNFVVARKEAVRRGRIRSLPENAFDPVPLSHTRKQAHTHTRAHTHDFLLWKKIRKSKMHRTR